MQSQAVKWNCFSQCYCWNMLHVVAIWYPVKMRLSINLLIFSFPFLFVFKIDSFVYRPYPDYSLLSLYSSPWVQTSPPTWTTLCFSLKNKTKKAFNNEIKHNTVRKNINQHTAFGKNKQTKKKKLSPKKDIGKKGKVLSWWCETRNLQRRPWVYLLLIISGRTCSRFLGILFLLWQSVGWNKWHLQIVSNWRFLLS